MKYKGLNDNKITVEAGIANGIIGKARKRGSLSQENISKILLKYSDLDANWLFTGKGEMFLTGSASFTEAISNAPCSRCEDKDTIISLLKEKVAEQKAKIASLEGNSSGEINGKRQTA